MEIYLATTSGRVEADPCNQIVPDQRHRASMPPAGYCGRTMSIDSTHAPEGHDVSTPLGNRPVGHSEVSLERTANMLSHLHSLLLKLERQVDSSATQ